MKKIFLSALSLAVVMALASCSGSSKNSSAKTSTTTSAMPANATHTLYDFSAKTIDGKDFNLSSLKGKKVLIVNTASECGFTPQYADLEKLYQQYGGDKFTIIGFPSNDFGAQEPGSNAEIKTFCTKNYGVTFQMMEKIEVVGDKIDPLYNWLTHKSENGVEDAPVKWNFQKFLIDENGHYVKHYNSAVNPMSDEITGWAKGS